MRIAPPLSVVEPMRALFVAMFAVVMLVGWRAGGQRTATPPRAGVAQEAGWRPHADAGTIELPRGPQGHFFVDGDVAGTPLHFVVDTGASDVALSREDAARLGLVLTDASFDGKGETASGIVRVAHVTLPRVRIGEIQLMDVQAAVLDVPSGLALLGQSFLARLDKVAIERDRMTLTKL